ncbi:MAG: ATP-binding protein [Thermoleophilia bacterium]|nr:ATP-binding protein [Thermoleophilia bacterium]
MPTQARQLSFTLADRDLSAVMRVRDEVREMAATVGLGERAHDLAVAATELVANALEHGCPPVDVTVRWNGRFTLDVDDAGSAGSPPDSWGLAPPGHTGERGRGVWIVRQMVDSFDARSGPGGTHVRVSLSPDRVDDAIA